MNPLRIFLLAALVFVFFGVNNAEAGAGKISLEIIEIYEGDSDFQSVAISENYAYVANWGNGFLVLDIESPSNPILVGSCDTIDYAWGLAISGNVAFVADSDGGLVVIDIEDPTNPSIVGNYDTGTARDVAISGNYAYVADWDNGLVIVDVEDPSNPTLVGSFNEDDEVALSVVLSGDYAYVSKGSYGLDILNVEDPSDPYLLGSYSGEVNGADISGNYAYIAAGDSYKLEILNIEDPSNPFSVAAKNTNGWGTDVSVSGGFAYVTTSYGLEVLNIENPTTPIFVSDNSSSTDGVANDVTIVGNYVFVPSGNELYIMMQEFIPIATIDLISPSSARFSEDFSFSGSGEDYDGVIEDYEWMSSINGFLSNEEDFNITALSPGSHNISFRVKDNSNIWSDYDYFDLIVNPNQFPTATIDSIKYAYSPNASSAEQGTNVSFNGTGFDSDGAVEVYFWESSIDGFLSDDEDFSITNLSIGRHTVYFKVQDNDGNWSSISQWELWIYTVPIAIAGQNATGTPGVPLQFSGAGTDEDGTIAKYEWDFDGDGIFEWSSTENGRELNIYNNEGTYTATLRVTDNDGFTSSDTVTVIISEKTIQLDDDGNVVVEDAGEDDEGTPSVSLFTALISIGLLAIFRRK